MYRHYTACVACERALADHECELDDEARSICTRCNTLRRFDVALARWREEARARRWLQLAGGALALFTLAMLPKLILVLLAAFVLSAIVHERS